MYSAVLMLALTAGTDAVDHGRGGCHGCSVCSYSTGCSYSSCHGGHGLFNRGHGCSSCHHARRGHHRCSGCYSSCYSGCYGGVCSGGVYPVLPAPTKEMPKKSSATNAPATIVVSLPADARLVVDGSATSSTSENRTLVTPALEFGSTYVYTMQASIVRDGQTVTQTQEVTVRGGEVFNINFSFPTQAVASR